MNLFALGSIDYFSVGGLPFILLAAWGIWVFQPVITLFHEWGHALVAYLLTEDEIRITVGERGKNSGLKPIKIGKRISCRLYFNNARVGSTEFVAAGKWQRLFILLGGPLISAGITLYSMKLLFFEVQNLWVEVFLISWFCGNFLTLVRSVIPMRLRSTQAFPQGCPSDGLQIIQLLISLRR